jgi:hypothetical protein
VAQVWIQSVHNLHCPSCDTRLVQRGRCAVPEQGAARYVGEVGTLACPSGHVLPDRPVLYAYRDRRGLAGSAPVREVPGPR